MDGESRQKVIIQNRSKRNHAKLRYVLWTFAAVAMLGLLFVCGMSYVGNIREKQMQELIAIHPELQQELQDNFSYYQGQVAHAEWIMMAVLVFLLLVFGAILLQMKRQEQKRTLAAYDDELDRIYEQLVRFQKGDFESVLSAEETVVADRFHGLHEKLRELGYYFSDMKVRLTEEENSTKALITDISHQLKTPLASVRMCHELAQSPDLSEEERSSFMETETQEIAKMEVLLGELVKLSRLESNMIRIKPETNSLKQTIREAVGQIYMKAHAKNIEICADMEEDAEILHDRKWTVEALANILENAVKYSTSMTKIYIRMSRLPSNVLIEIEDEGIGIPEEELHEIFHRFYRGSNAKEMAKEGAGVGLYLAGNKKKSAITICSMAATGLFFMVVATVLSCADPTEASKNSIHAQYQISPVIEFNNKEHPELEWAAVQKRNPLTEELKQQILQIDGIIDIETYTGTFVTSDAFDGEREWLAGVPETGKEQLEAGIIEGNTTYEELKSGDKVIVDKNLLYWWPGLQVGDVLDVTVEDGDGTHERKLEIAAIGRYPLSFTNYSYLIMAQEGLATFSDHNLNFYYHIYAEKPYDSEVEAQLKEIVETSGRMRLRVWKDVFEEYKSNMALTSGVCYVFLGILGMICIMNMINTMIHSVHVRKKELGMLQAVGMSDGQLRQMLQTEGLFYTLGTLLIAVGGGSLAGYPVFLWARDNSIFNISNYHYPAQAAIVVIIVLLCVQSILTVILQRATKKESLIDRIRFSD